MQNPIQKFRQSSIVFEKPGIFFQKLKTFTSSNYRRLCWNFCWSSFPNQCLQKGFRDIFFILFRTWVICQNQKWPSFYPLTETRFINNSRSKQNKENPEHPFVHIGKTKMCTKFYQKILNSVVVGARQSFQFFREITWFLGNKRALS